MITLVHGQSRPRLSQRLRGRFWRELDHLLPNTAWGDRLMTWSRFVATHRRLPHPDGTLLNDRLYRIKTSGALDDPLCVLTSDKELVKLYVAAVLGDSYNVPTLQVLRSVAACEQYAFPARCIVKATHTSGGPIRRRDSEPIDMGRIAAWFATNYYRSSRESNYRRLVPKVIVEPFVFDDDNPNDYKIFCVAGMPRMLQVDTDRHARHTRTLFDTRWKPLPYAYKYPLPTVMPSRPPNLDAMLDAAARLSARFGLVRVDLYSNGRDFRVGELTHCPESANGAFHPAEGEHTVSALLFGSALSEETTGRPYGPACAELPSAARSGHYRGGQTGSTTPERRASTGANATVE